MTTDTHVKVTCDCHCDCRHFAEGATNETETALRGRLLRKGWEFHLSDVALCPDCVAVLRGEPVPPSSEPVL